MMVHCVDDYVLCIKVIPNPENEDEIWIQETDYPDVVVKTSRENWVTFLQQCKNGDLDGV